MRRQLHILFFLLLSAIAWGQTDSIPFLKASLMVGEPSDIYPQTVFGHAFLRLQCPEKGLDNCFSMESGDYEGFRDIVTGNYPNRLVVILTKEYLSSFDAEGRVVTEYPLNLSQKEIQRLWKYLDEKNASGLSPYHDFFHHGCSQEMIRFLSDNLDGHIVYGERAKNYGNTLFTLGTQTLPLNSWIRIPFVMLLSTDGTDNKLEDSEKTAVPFIIPDLFSDAVIMDENGQSRPVLSDEAPHTYRPQVPFKKNTNIPIYLWAAFLLVLVVLLSCIGTKYPWISKGLDVMLFLFYILITISLIAVCFSSSLPTTSGWNWNYIIYNPIPLIIWLYGKLKPLHWSFIYAIYAFWILAFLLILFIVGDHYVMGQYLMALSFAVRCVFKAFQKINKQTI